MTTLTRAEYMKQYTRENGHALHRQYYGQFVGPAYVEAIAQYIGKGKLLASTDRHLNDIPLVLWERSPIPHGTTEKMKAAGDYLTKAGHVCIAKEAARQWLDKNKGE